jgi:hypothetical protein
MGPDESVLCRFEDMEEGVKFGTVLHSGTKESINRQSKTACIGDRESLPDLEESSFWVAVVQDVVSGQTMIVTEQDFQVHDDAQSCSDAYETLNWGDGQLGDTQSALSTQIRTHYIMCPTALMDKTFAGEPSIREISSMNGVTLTNYLFSCYLRKPPVKGRTQNLVVSDESVPCNTKDRDERIKDLSIHTSVNEYK